MFLIIEIGFVLLIIFLIGTQIILPKIKDLPMFPMFRNTTEKLQDKILDQHERLVETALEKEIARNEQIIAQANEAIAAIQSKIVDKS